MHYSPQAILPLVMRYNEMMPKNALVIAVLVLLLFISSRSFLLGKLFFLHDFTHAARISEMSRGLQAGDFPVQWSQNFGYGYGMPLFLFYGPLAYYVGAIIYLIGGSISWSVLSLLLLSNISTLFGSYLLGKTLGGRSIGLLLATLYTLAPYRAVNLFLRGAINEVWAMAFLPWLLLGWLFLIKKQKYGNLLIALSTAAIIMSHNLSALYFLPFGVLFGFGMYVWQFSSASKFSKQSLTVFIKGIASSLLGTGLSAYYAIPAFVEKSLTRLDDQVLTGYFDYHNHFLYLRQFLLDKWTYGGSEWGPNDGINFFLGYGVILGLLLAGLQLFRRHLPTQSKYQKMVLIVLFGVLTMTILLTTQKTIWVWEHLSVLPYLQFPWRLMSLITLICSLIISLSLSQKQSYRQLILKLIILITMITSFRYFVPGFYYETSKGPYYVDVGRIQKDMSGILPDYLPKTFNSEIEPFQQLVAESEMVKQSILKDSVSEKLIQLNSKTDTQLTISIAYFPGWKAYLDGVRTTTSLNQDGLTQVMVPKGEHLLSLKFEATPIRQISNTISIIALVITISIVYQETKTHYKRKYVTE